MICLSWNCRGLGNPRSVYDLCLLTKNKSPQIVFLMKTLLISNKIEIVKRKLGFENCFCVDPAGWGRGLAFLWKSEINLEIYNFSLWHISSWNRDAQNSSRWLLTGFYGHPDTNERKDSWNLLGRLNSLSDAWCIVGDFNDIMFGREKKWKKIRPESQMVSFRNVILENNMLKIWNKNRKTVNEKIFQEKSEVLSKIQWDEGCNNLGAINDLQKELGDLLESEDLNWKQCAKLNWYKMGDQNTKFFFHNCVT